MISRIALVTILAILLGSIFIVYAISQAYFHVTNIGNVQTIGIQLLDSSLDSVTFIDWGSLNPGTMKSYRYYLYNNGTTSETANFTILAWTPASAEFFITLEWNYTSQIISSGASLPVLFTLTISNDIIGINDFSFDLVIIGNEV